MRILFICTNYSGYVVQLYNCLKKYYADVEINILTLDRNGGKYKEELGLNDDNIITSSDNLVTLSIGKAIKQLPQFDIVQAFWMELPWGMYAKSLKKRASVLYVEVGGSDLYKESKNIVFYQLQKRLIKYADVVSSENDDTKKIFLNTYKKVAKGKPHYVVRFGVDVIDELKEMNNSQLDGLKEKWGIPQNKIIIMCGHNGSPAHRHKEMMEAIRSLSEESLKHLFFIIPMAYGAPDKEYVVGIKELIASVTDNYLIQRDYLTCKQMAEFARMTDIMIHVQTTDQLSSTMMAHMYDENIVIAGSWLPYGQIKDEGIKFWEVDDISELTDLMTDMIENLDTYKMQCEGNREKVYKFSSWEYCIKDWYNVYETLLAKKEDA